MTRRRTILDAEVLLGDCLDHLCGLPDNSVDSIVCDPPYGLSKPPRPDELHAILRAWMAGEACERGGGGFLGAAWDAFVPDPRVWAECLRVVKPGGHLIAFAGSRTVDLMGLSLRLGGWEVRDSVGWVYWEGRPAGLNVGKAIDKQAGAEREVIGPSARPDGTTRPNADQWRDGMGYYGAEAAPRVDTAPATPEAARWEGWNTTLAPTIEPALLCRKPLSEGAVAANVLRWGTGALNIDACRWAPGAPEWLGPNDGLPSTHSQSKAAANGCHTIGDGWQGMETHQSAGQKLGRWPGNLVYVPKASTAERERGCDGLPVRLNDRRNSHSCVKPVRLLRWLCRLVTPPGGLVVDPFAGSGSCGVAAVLDGFEYIGMEQEGPEGPSNPPEDYHSVAVARVAHAQRYPDSWVNTEPGRVEKVKDPERKERAAKGGQQSLFGG